MNRMAAPMIAREASPWLRVDLVPEIRRWTRQEYERAAELGIFRPDERLELIGGEVFRKVRQGPMHATTVQLADNALRRRVGVGLSIRTQLPLVFGDDSEPEPDVALVEGTPDDYAHAHPTTALLVIEVADSTLRFDRTIKASLYASAGIQEYWVLAVEDHALECFREPEIAVDQPFGHHYRGVTRYTEDGQVTPLFGSSPLAVRDLFPRRRA